MRDEHKDNQAAKLEQLFLEVSNPELDKKKLEEKEPDELVEVDVLQLPPRSEVHKTSKSSLHLSFHAPVWRFVLVIIFLVAVAWLLYGFYGEEMIEFFTA